MPEGANVVSIPADVIVSISSIKTDESLLGVASGFVRITSIMTHVRRT